MRKTLLLLWMLGLGMGLAAQEPKASQVELAPVEELVYTGYYNWGILWVKAGRVSFTLSDSEKYPGAQRLEAIGHSLPSWDWVFYIRDTLISTYDSVTFKPYEFYRVAREGKSYHKTFNYVFDYQDSLIYGDIHRIGKYLKKDTVKMTPETFDMLSVAWRARQMDFDSFQKNETIPINILIDGKIYNLYIRYLGTEKIKVDGKRQECYVFSPLLVQGSVFKGGEDMKIWISKDRDRVPLMVEAKILVGSVKAILDRKASRYGGGDA